MKAYLTNILNRYKKYSENLDVKTAICNKSWWVFNDSGEKELYIFQEDYTLLISLSGRVTKGTWEYVSANRSLIITAQNESYMLHVAFMDNVLFAMQVDGTQKYSFMIDENNRTSFKPRTLNELQCYFEEKEQAKLLEERQRQNRLEWERQEAERQRQKRLEQERREAEIQRQKRLEQERLEEKKKKLDALKKEAEEQWEIESKSNWTIRKKIIKRNVVSIILCIGAFSGCIVAINPIRLFFANLGTLGSTFFIILLFLPGFLVIPAINYNSKNDSLERDFKNNYIREQAKKQNIDIDLE